MAKIKNVPYGWEFDVWCRDCEKVITVEGPKDLKKKIVDGKLMFCLECPNCKKEIWFDGIVGHTLSPEFVNQVETKE